jgi:hypothetical protein
MRAPRDGGTHALVAVRGTLRCAFCDNACADDLTVIMVFSSNACPCRAFPVGTMEPDALNAIRERVEERKRNGVAVPVVVKYNDADTADFCIEIDGVRVRSMAR